MLRVKAQTTLRIALLENGYSFFPCRGKAGQRAGWPNIVPTRELIDEWSHELSGISTALHVGRGGLVMVDWDIDDPVMAELVDDMPDDLWAVFGNAPVRTSGKMTEAWAVRLAPGTASVPYALRSLRFFKGDDRTKGHRLEVFMRHPKAFVAYGAHTIDDRGEVTREYSWLNDRGPHNVPLAALPEVSLDVLERLVLWVNRTMVERGWQADKTGAVGRVEPREAFDIQPDAVFSTERGFMTRDELIETLRNTDRVFLSASWLDGRETPNRNHRRCVASLRYDGLLAIFDFAEYVQHLPVEAEQRGLSQSAVDKLRDMAALNAAQKIENGSADGDSILATRTAQLLRELAFATQDRCVIPLDGSPAMTMATLRNREAPFALTIRGPRGGIKTISPADQWLKDPGRIDVSGSKFNPTTEERIFEDDEGRWVNLWTGLPPIVNPDGLGHWTTFLTHLLPNEREREWFENWLAVKAQHPAVPGAAVLMVTPTSGTGRGTLFDILRGVFGRKHVSPITSVQLMGGTGQGVYTDWLETALLVTCDELSGGAEHGEHMRWKRIDIYERLKTLIDPRLRNITIIRKGLPNYKTDVFAGFLLASNHEDALYVDENDRRFAILTNTRTPLIENPVAWAAVEAVRDANGVYRPEFLSAVRQHLLTRPANVREAREAPRWTEGRLSMIGANRDAMDDLFEDVLTQLTAEGRDYIRFDELNARLRVACADMVAEGMDSPGNWRRVISARLGGNGLAGWRRHGARVEVRDPDGRRLLVRVYYRIDGPGMEPLLALPVKERLAVIDGKPS
jgi:hypothetical protein